MADQELNDNVQEDPRTLRDLQAELVALDFEGAEHVTSKKLALSILKSLGNKEVKANKAIEINTPVASDNVKEDTEHHAGKALIMKEHLAKQPRVWYAIPLGIKEKKGAYETVTLNGYRLSIMKGVQVQLPQQVVTLLMDSYEQTESAGQEYLMDRDESVASRLQ